MSECVSEYTLHTLASSYWRSLMAPFFESNTSSSFLVTKVRAEGSRFAAEITSVSCASCFTDDVIITSLLMLA